MNPRDLTAAVLAAAMQIPLRRAELWRGPIALTWDLFSITTPKRQCAYIGHVGHESAGLARVAESFDYSPERLLGVFGRHRISVELARLYGRRDNRAANQEAIANIVYGGAWGLRNLGNTEPGDGWRYRGRGPIQTTGRRNYARARDGLREALQAVPDFELDPQQLELPVWGAPASGLFWHERRLNEMADAGDLDEQTRAINGGSNGLEERRERIAHAATVIF